MSSAMWYMLCPVRLTKQNNYSYLLLSLPQSLLNNSNNPTTSWLFFLSAAWVNCQNFSVFSSLIYLLTSFNLPVIRCLVTLLFFCIEHATGKQKVGGGKKWCRSPHTAILWLLLDVTAAKISFYTGVTWNIWSDLHKEKFFFSFPPPCMTSDCWWLWYLP